MIAIGRPLDEFVKVKRKPIAKVIHWEKWSSPSRWQGTVPNHRTFAASVGKKWCCMNGR
jgi:hypothetical protein